MDSFGIVESTPTGTLKWDVDPPYAIPTRRRWEKSRRLLPPRAPSPTRRGAPPTAPRRPPPTALARRNSRRGRDDRVVPGPRPLPSGATVQPPSVPVSRGSLKFFKFSVRPPTGSESGRDRGLPDLESRHVRRAPRRSPAHNLHPAPPRDAKLATATLLDESGMAARLTSHFRRRGGAVARRSGRRPRPPSPWPRLFDSEFGKDGGASDVPSPTGRGWPEGPGEGRRASGYALGLRHDDPTAFAKRDDPHPPPRGRPLPVG